MTPGDIRVLLVPHVADIERELSTQGLSGARVTIVVRGPDGEFGSRELAIATNDGLAFEVAVEHRLHVVLAQQETTPSQDGDRCKDWF